MGLCAGQRDARIKPGWVCDTWGRNSRTNHLDPHPGAATLPKDSSGLGCHSRADGLSLSRTCQAHTRPNPARGIVLCSVSGSAVLGAAWRTAGAAGGRALRGGKGSQVSSPGARGRGAMAYGRCDRRGGEKGQILLAKLLSGLLCGMLGWGFLLPDLSPRTEEGQTCKFKTLDMLG